MPDRIDDNSTVHNVDLESHQIDTGWKNPPLLTDLKQNYQDAYNHHSDHVDQVNGWLDNLYITGSAVHTYRKNRSQVTPKLIRKQAEWRYASLSESFLSDEDIFNAEPVTYEDVKAAEQNQLILNHQFNNQIDKVAFIDEYVRAAVNEGSVVVRLGWEFKEEERDEPVLGIMPIQNPVKAQLVEEAASRVLQTGSTEGIQPELVRAVKLSVQAGGPVELAPTGKKEKKMMVVKNCPTVEVCDFASVMVDPTCKGDIKNARFVIYAFETSLSELEAENYDSANPRYSNLDKINIEVTATPGLEETASTHDEETGAFSFKDKPRKRFMAYEYWGYWDKDETGIVQPFVATWVGDTMIRMEESPFPDKELPFVLVKYLPKRKDIYGEPDGELLIENQKIAGAVTRGMIDMMGRSAVGQTGYRKDALDVTNRRKFDDGKDYEFNPQVMDPRQAFYQHTFPEIPQSAAFMLQLQNNEAESITGVKAFADRGISGEGLGRSATAARSALDAAGKRELGILRRLAGGVIEIGRKIMAMNTEWLSEEEIFRVTNDEFIQVKRDDLKGKIDIKLNISTAEADDNKAQELAFMLQTVGNSLPQEFSLMIMAEIAKLRKMPALAKRIEDYEPQPDPFQEQMQQLELAQKQADIEKTRSEAAENFAEAELDIAQAGKAQSERDRVDLDFVEQETGTAHARDVDRIESQAKSNIELEAVKAALSPTSGNSAPSKV